MTYRIRLHPAVAEDLAAIAEMVAGYAGARAAERRLQEIEAVVSSLAETPFRGSQRDEIAPGLRAIPAGRKAVIAFSVDQARREVFVHVIGFAGSDWMARRADRG